jgi:hypothetical protein
MNTVLENLSQNFSVKSIFLVYLFLYVCKWGIFCFFSPPLVVGFKKVIIAQVWLEVKF